MGIIELLPFSSSLPLSISVNLFIYLCIYFRPIHFVFDNYFVISLGPIITGIPAVIRTELCDVFQGTICRSLSDTDVRNAESSLSDELL